MTPRGVVLKKTDIGEDNQLITFYTRDFGKLTGVAKSVKKSSSKQASHLELFNLVDFRLIAGKTQSIIASAQSLETFTYLKDSLDRLAAGYFILEAFNRLIYEHEKDAMLWNFIQEALIGLNRAELIEGELAEYIAKTKENFLNVLGYTQYWDKKEVNYFLESLSQRKFSSLDFINSVS